MRLSNITDLLKSNPYPGRGIMLGLTPDRTSSIMAYFIMGRSENSRNRIFVTEPDGIRTMAYDPDKLTDPSLVIYHPVRITEDRTIITNGDQTDTILDYLTKGGSFQDALETREFEPDGPNYTPRISSLLYGDGSYDMSILKSSMGNPDCCQRFYFRYPAPIAGCGHFIHTYRCDGSPLPSFEGEPIAIATQDDINALADAMWSALDAENKVSLFVRKRNLSSGDYETIIKNKHQ